MSSLQLIQRLMVEQFELKLEDLSPGAQLESLGLDSLSVIEFMFKLEDELKIKLSDERVELKTIQDIVNFVDRLISDQKAPVGM
jgi:acyl carrier protein